MRECATFTRIESRNKIFSFFGYACFNFIISWSWNFVAFRRHEESFRSGRVKQCGSRIFKFRYKIFPLLTYRGHRLILARTGILLNCPVIHWIIGSSSLSKTKWNQGFCCSHFVLSRSRTQFIGTAQYSWACHIISADSERKAFLFNLI